MKVDTELADRIIALLNKALELDPESINALVNTRVPCNAALADHPTIQVGRREGATTIGFMGLLNGLCGVDETGWGPIASMNEVHDGKVSRVTGFVRTDTGLVTRLGPRER